VCNRQLGQLTEVYAEFEKRGVPILVVDAQERFRARHWKQARQYPFPILSDPTARVCALYGVAKQLMVHDEWVNLPAAFVVDKAGILRYAYVGKGFSDRATAAGLLSVLDHMK
jgi:peroxiredoxin